MRFFAEVVDSPYFLFGALAVWSPSLNSPPGGLNNVFIFCQKLLFNHFCAKMWKISLTLLKIRREIRCVGIPSYHRDTVDQEYAICVYSRFDGTYVMLLR